MGKEYQRKYSKNTNAFKCKNKLHLTNIFVIKIETKK